MITPLDSKVMDANSEALGVSAATLMGNAGRAVANLLIERYHGKRFVFFCGRGNNGGDGFAAASMMEGEDVTVVLVDDPSRMRSEAALSFFFKLGVPRGRMPVEGEFDVLVDAGLGTGMSGDLRPRYREFVEYANSFAGDVVSVDVPTGLGCAAAVKPDLTIALHDAKEGMTEENCGEIVVADIGIPRDAWRRTGPGDMLRYPVPSEDSRKGDGGRLLVIGGGPYCGAPAMAALAALRVGTDLVTVATPESGYSETAAFSPVFVMKRLRGDVLAPSHVKRLLSLAEGADAVLIGPGIGRDGKTAKAVNEFVSQCGKPAVIDADGLNALGDSFVSENPAAVLTPHRGEFARLGGKDGDAKALASRAKCVVLLKGRDDIISDGIRCRINSTGCAGMTGAGTGDVLAGIVAGLMAKGMGAFDAACLGAYISGKAGELAFDKNSYGMTADDIIGRIPKVLKKGLGERRRWTCNRFLASPP